MANVKYLKDYQSPDFWIEHIDCDIILDPIKTDVHSVLKCIKNQKVKGELKDLTLNGEELTLIEVKLNGRLLQPGEYEKTDSSLTILNISEDRFTLETHCLIHPQANTALSGLYLSSDIFCTQCEAEGFRRITYYLDRPDVMATFTTRITANKAQYPILLANGDCTERGDLPNGLHWATWHDGAKKPCYLFALVAGNLACQESTYTTRTGKTVDLRFYAEKGNVDYGKHALDVLKKAMLWDEKRYQREYDLSTYMIVAINDFNMGAMENKGLNIFNAKCVLADPSIATDQDYAWIEAVVSHEYFHNWTGNRITCRDWFQLSLKEGLTVFREQQFCQDQLSPVVQRINDVKRLWARQFPEDAGPLAHSVQPDSYLEIDNFYTMTVYEKGAEVIRMLPWIVGEEGFDRGMQYYFTHYDGQAVTINELIGSIEKANDIDLEQFMLWYQQAGTPKVTVGTEYNPDKKQYVIHLSQHCPDTPGQTHKKPMMIPIVVGLLDQEGRSLTSRQASEKEHRKQHVLLLTEKEQQFTFVDVPQKPIPSLGRDFSAPVKIEYTYDPQDILTLAQHDPDGFNRWQAIQKVYYHSLEKLIAMPPEAPMVIDNGFVAFYKSLLEENFDDALFKALCLTLPTPDEIAALSDHIDVDRINTAYLFLQQQFAEALTSSLFALYESQCSNQPYAFTPAEYGRRALLGCVLHLLNKVEGSKYADVAMNHYQAADNMTDKMIALSAINHSSSEMRTELLSMFYNDWHDQPLVLDSWFRLQAVSYLEHGYDDVKQLCQHKQFTLKNPNRVRALLGAFSTGLNPNFHRTDGKGYQLLTDAILQLDDINPHLAANLLTPLTQWRRYDATRQQHMRDCLQQIAQKPNLSTHCAELVKKA